MLEFLGRRAHKRKYNDCKPRKCTCWEHNASFELLNVHRPILLTLTLTLYRTVNATCGLDEETENRKNKSCKAIKYIWSLRGSAICLTTWTKFDGFVVLVEEFTPAKLSFKIFNGFSNCVAWRCDICLQALPLGQYKLIVIWSIQTSCHYKGQYKLIVWNNLNWITNEGNLQK